MIAAILRAQLLSMRMGGRGRVFSVLTGLFWYGVWVIVACAVYLGVSGASADRLQIILPLGALAVCLYWQAMPILSASMGSALDMRKLMVYPVPHARLFQIEVLLRLTTGVEMLMVLAGSVAGMFHRSASMGWLSLPAVLIYIAFNLLLASGTRSLLERLLSRRKDSRAAGLRDFHAVDAAAFPVRDRPSSPPDGQLDPPDGERSLAVDRRRLGRTGTFRTARAAFPRRLDPARRMVRPHPIRTQPAL